MHCPRCRESRYSKEGMAGGRQRYRCKSCDFRYMVEQIDTKRLALAMYLEGLGFRAISRIFTISYGTVYQWTKKWTEQANLPQNPQGTLVVELDEMYRYIGSKKTTAGSGLLLINLAKATSRLWLGTDPPKRESDSGRN